MKDCTKVRNLEIIGFIVTVPLIFLFHFLFELSGGNLLLAPISAVNESVWEHTKIIFFPYLLFAIVEYFILDVPIERFLVAKTAGLLSIIVLMITFFYTYTGIIGHEILIVDIISAFLWSAVAFYISYRLICSDLPIEKLYPVAVILLIIMIAAEVIFTFYPPHIQLFYDTEGQFYGIK